MTECISSPSVFAAKDLISKTLVPDPGSRIKLSEMKLHPWMDHPDSGPTPSKPTTRQRCLVSESCHVTLSSCPSIIIMSVLYNHYHHHHHA
jgi:hypothetical protein